MGRERQVEWEKRVAGWRESGLTAKAFAAEAGVNANTLTHWAWQLRRKRGEERLKPRMKAQAKAAAVEWVELSVPGSRPNTISKSSSVRATSPCFEVVVGTRTIRVPAGFDGEGLRRLITVLEGL